MIRPWASSAALILMALAGCHSKNDSPPPSVATTPTPTVDQAITKESSTDRTITQEAPSVPVIYNPTEAISAARNSLKAGAVDEAAARLAQLRIQGASFNAQQAKDYRQALSEAYDRAIEAAERGDPKAQAAIQLLRAAAPR
jgi:hypothetical protein